MSTKQTVLITGCSKGGLGDALARAFHLHGLRVIATARNPSKMEHFKSLGIETLVLDVLSEESISRCVANVSEMTGGSLDILLNNSGIGHSMPLVDAKIEAVQGVFALNVFAILSVSKAFLPLILKSFFGGMIVNNTSIASIASVPLQGVYSASKAAAASLSATLRLELAPFGIKVVEMKTGVVRSNFLLNVADGLGASTVKLPEDSIYNPAREEIETILRGTAIESMMVDADVWAKNVVGDLTRKSPPATVWRGAQATLAWFGKTFVPAFLLDIMYKKAGAMDVLERRLNGQGGRAKVI